MTAPKAPEYGLLLMLFLVASALTPIVGTMVIVNLTHGSCCMIGAYRSCAQAPFVARNSLAITPRNQRLPASW